jgi:hypothetical protein
MHKMVTTVLPSHPAMPLSLSPEALLRHQYTTNKLGDISEGFGVRWCLWFVIRNFVNTLYAKPLAQLQLEPLITSRN